MWWSAVGNAVRKKRDWRTLVDKIPWEIYGLAPERIVSLTKSRIPVGLLPEIDIRWQELWKIWCIRPLVKIGRQNGLLQGVMRFMAKFCQPKISCSSGFTTGVAVEVCRPKIRCFSAGGVRPSFCRPKIWRCAARPRFSVVKILLMVIKFFCLYTIMNVSLHK